MAEQANVGAGPRADPDLSPQEIQAIAEDLDINVPIMSYKVVGGRVELHLYGGGIAIHETQPAKPNETDVLGQLVSDIIEQQLHDLRVRDLRKIAKELGITRTSMKLRKELLIELAARAELDPAAVQEAIRKVT